MKITITMQSRAFNGIKTKRTAQRWYAGHALTSLKRSTGFFFFFYFTDTAFENRIVKTRKRVLFGFCSFHGGPRGKYVWLRYYRIIGNSKNPPNSNAGRRRRAHVRRSTRSARTSVMLRYPGDPSKTVRFDLRVSQKEEIRVVVRQTWRREISKTPFAGLFRSSVWISGAIQSPK